MDRAAPAARRGAGLRGAATCSFRSPSSSSATARSIWPTRRRRRPRRSATASGTPTWRPPPGTCRARTHPARGRHRLAGPPRRNDACRGRPGAVAHHDGPDVLQRDRGVPANVRLEPGGADVPVLANGAAEISLCCSAVIMACLRHRRPRRRRGGALFGASYAPSVGVITTAAEPVQRSSMTAGIAWRIRSRRGTLIRPNGLTRRGMYHPHT